ncbi:NAD+ synthase [Jatrophihabitans telluris]|uniref:Glutamine-dependent NAD(+) synthetase n=1 Tax=Jatrophihabitans telluris TaxID=2038343 RepID=A0ABY4QVY8_9ACTN|nr:NAD+ synthase [Jatrophihabitans telluris]UQX87292.1 NAD+ synthase [Jatrophihabitans telluris]
MSTLRIGMAQVDLTVGDFDRNVELVLRRVGEAAEAGAQLVVFPEMTLTGYMPEDLVLRRSFREASRQALTRTAATLAEAGYGDIAVVVGYLDSDCGARNAAAFVQNGEVVARYFKYHLPTYGVFDEDRYFVPGTELVVIRFGGVDVALTICEDVWQDGGPFTAAAAAEVGLLLNINGSPYERNKDDIRFPLVARRAREAGAPVVYVNQVGGQDELVFDGDSFVVDAGGRLLARAPQYAEGMFYLDLEVAPAVSNATPVVGDLRVRRVDAPLPPRALPAAADLPEVGIAERLVDEEEVWRALVTGTRDYARKNGFASVVLGLSGGIDSAVVAAIAADALGGDAVHGVGMPSAYSSDHSRSDAADLARRVGAHYQVVEVEAMVRAFVHALKLTGLAEENVQARVRGTTLMGLSNQHGHLVLATGNKSELAVGYSTIYGDAVGGFAPIKDVPKSLVWRLARWRNDDAVSRGHTPPIPENSISKPPSAELRPGQLDSDSLPDYELLDAVLLRYVDADAGFADLVAEGFDPALVTRVAHLVDAAEWKRRQYPPGPKISYKAFGKDRRLPITNRWRESRAAR